MTPRRAVLLLTFCLASALPTSAQFLRVYYPDIEQGSSTLVVSPTGRALLIDAGTGIRTTDIGVEDLINDLIEAGVVTSVDFTLATHYDEDHIGRMENVFQLVPLDPAAIAYDRGDAFSTPTTFAFSDYLFGATLQNRTTVPVCTVIPLGGGVTATVMTVNGEVCGAAPVDVIGAGQFENNVSISVLLEYGDVDIWIGGDLTGNPETGVVDVESVVAPLVGDVDIYTVNHHGSETSSNATFLETLMAETAINQNSASNNFGHPRAVIFERILATPDTHGGAPRIFQQNPGDVDDTRSDDLLSTFIADCDDPGSIVLRTGFESGNTSAWCPAPPAKACGTDGTIQVISDGTSYRIHACGIPGVLTAADEVAGSPLDVYPPAVRRVRRTPHVPWAVQSAQIEADLFGATSAEILYAVDDIEQVAIPMSLACGNTWTAAIPPQPNGTRVTYRVEATNATGDTELSIRQGYFSGKTTIAALRLNDADGVLEPKRYGVRIEGNLTAEPGVFNTSVTQAWVQDASGGLQIFDPELLVLSRGDLVRFTGELEQFGGLTEISLAAACDNIGHTLLGAGVPPAPEVISVAQAASEAFEGKLVRVNGVTVVEGTIPEIGSGNLTITDDGGISTVSLRIDDTTDLLGAVTPVLPFDVVGVLSQFDSWVPLTSGYQVQPRGRADLDSPAVNPPPVILNELHLDPAAGLAGDANGDGVASTADDEFIEVLNLTGSEVDLTGWTLRVDGAVRHTFGVASIPAREPAVVFGGGTPTGAFGNTMANGLVFTASTGSLSLVDTAGTVELRDDLSNLVQSVTYGAPDSNQDQSITRPDLANTPFVLHTAAPGGVLYSPGARTTGQAFTLLPGAVLLSEVFYDASGSDDELEWIELHNPTGSPLDLSDACIGAGGADYTNTLIALDGLMIPAGGVAVIGGPVSDGSNANPVFDLEVDFEPDIQNAGSTADGVAIFNQRCSGVTSLTVPIDAVVYGGANNNGLIDETGVANPPEVGDASSGQSVERIDLAGAWQIQANPSPGVTVVP